jgi:hypothetical protein
MATTPATGVAIQGSLEGAEIGVFTIPSGAATGDIITVADPGINANSQVFLEPQGTGGAITYNLQVTAVTAGTGFSVTYRGSGSTTSNIICAFLRTA